MTITIIRKNETLTAQFEGTTKLRSTFNQRIYINNTLNHRIYQKLPDGQNKKIAETSIKEMQLRTNENETKVTGVTKIIFKDEEQNTLTINAKNIYQTDLDGKLYHDVNHYKKFPNGIIGYNRKFNEFMNQLLIKVVEFANQQLRQEQKNLHKKSKPYPKVNKYEIKKTEDKTVITLPPKSVYTNTYHQHTYWNNQENSTLKFEQDDEVITLSVMALHKIIINKAYENLNETKYSDVQFQFRAGNDKVWNITLPDDVNETYQSVLNQLNLFYFYLDLQEGTKEYSESVYHLIDLMNIVLVELFKKVLKFDTNELIVDVHQAGGTAGDTIDLEAEVIDPYGDIHEGEITFYLED